MSWTIVINPIVDGCRLIDCMLLTSWLLDSNQIEDEIREVFHKEWDLIWRYEHHAQECVNTKPKSELIEECFKHLHRHGAEEEPCDGHRPCRVPGGERACSP